MARVLLDLSCCVSLPTKFLAQSSQVAACIKVSLIDDAATLLPEVRLRCTCQREMAWTPCYCAHLVERSLIWFTTLWGQYTSTVTRFGLAGGSEHQASSLTI
ncbi:hypothetical protein EV424DRAFT_1388098 [Suillus variegatus]|nr:hypothetical protein EV424DRAFT_1388098 [Suillus variegatus]